MTENAELQKQLTRKEAEITRAEEQQQMKQLVHTHMYILGTSSGFFPSPFPSPIVVCVIARGSHCCIRVQPPATGITIFDH